MGGGSGSRYPLSAIRYPLSAIRYPLSAIRYPLSAIRYPLSAIRYRYQPLSLHSHHDNESSLLLLFIHNYSCLHWHRQPRVFVAVGLLSHAMPFISAGGGGVTVVADTTTSTPSPSLPLDQTADQRQQHTIQISIQKS